MEGGKLARQFCLWRNNLSLTKLINAATGATESLGVKRPVYLGCFLLAILLPLLLSIPAAVNSGLTEKEPDRNRKIQEGKIYKNGNLQDLFKTTHHLVSDSSIQECRTSDNYTMILTYLVSSSVLFCFAMSFLFSLCIVGSPLLRSETMDHEEFLQRWRLLLSVALVNGLYIVTGFLLNFKEVSRLFYDCCAILEPFESEHNDFQIKFCIHFFTRDGLFASKGPLLFPPFCQIFDVLTCTAAALRILPLPKYLLAAQTSASLVKERNNAYFAMNFSITLFFPAGVNSVTYDVWSFVLLILEPVARPLVYLCFYLKFLLNDYSEMRH